MVKILLVDDHQTVRKQLHHILEQCESWEICGEAENGRQAIKKFDDTHPDVTVMDFIMPEMNGLEAARRIIEHNPNTAILMLSIDMSEELASEAKKAGVKGLCPKTQIMCILDAVNALVKGKTYYLHD